MRGLPVLLIILGVLVFTSRVGGPLPWLFFFFFVLPMLKGVFYSVAVQHDDAYKHKRMGNDVIIVDKPKREPRYVVGDDGELVEVYAEELYDEKPKRRNQYGDDLEYM
jgi:hypothetical protein